MKKHFFLPALPAVALAKAGIAFLLILFCHSRGISQVTIQDDAKVGLIVTGTGNTINTTQIFGKSPEYAELKKRLEALATAITKKADKCEKYTDPLAKEDCRAELIALNAERDSVQKIETRFREDVIRLAETFSRIAINSERLRLAKQLFDEGKIREADNILNAREMKMEGDALLAEKAREQEKLQRTDSLLRIKADEFALKARLKATDYADSLRYDSAQIYFQHSRRYSETVENLWDFAMLLWKDNQSSQAIPYLEKVLEMTQLGPNLVGPDQAAVAMMLGNCYSDVQNISGAAKMYMLSLKIFDLLVSKNLTEYEPDLATACMNMGILHIKNQKIFDAEKIFLRSLEIQERLAKTNPKQFEPNLAIICMNLAGLYNQVNDYYTSEKMYLRSIDIYERLSKSNPAQFAPELAKTYMGLGFLYSTIRKMRDAEVMYLHALEIQEPLAKVNPAKINPDLAMTVLNLGNFYNINQNLSEAEKKYLDALDIYERLAKSNPGQFDDGLAKTLGCLGSFYSDVQKMAEAEKMYLRSLNIFERLAKDNSAQFEPDLAGICLSLGVFYSDNNRQKEAISILGKGLVIQEKLAEKIPVMHTKSLAYMLNNLGFAYLKDGDLANARECLVKSELIIPDNSWLFRNWACLFALQNDVEKSLQNLKKAAELGYDDPNWILREKTLEAIENHTSFSEVLKQVKANNEKKGKH